MEKDGAETEVRDWRGVAGFRLPGVGRPAKMRSCSERRDWADARRSIAPGSSLSRSRASVNRLFTRSNCILTRASVAWVKSRLGSSTAIFAAARYISSRARRASADLRPISAAFSAVNFICRQPIRQPGFTQALTELSVLLLTIFLQSFTCLCEYHVAILV